MGLEFGARSSERIETIPLVAFYDKGQQVRRVHGRTVEFCRRGCGHLSIFLSFSDALFGESVQQIHGLNGLARLAERAEPAVVDRRDVAGTIESGQRTVHC